MRWSCSRWGLKSGVTSALVVVLASSPAHAREAGPRLGVAGLVETVGGGLSLDGRYRFGSGLQLGLVGASRGLSKVYFGGRKIEGAVAGDAQALLLVPLRFSGPLELDLRLTSGVRYARDLGEQSSTHEHALRSVTELACLAHVRLGERQLLRAGAILGVELETEPTQELADQTQLLTLGFGHALAPSALLYAQVDAGGSYGFDGDNGKALLRGALGLRFTFGGDAREGF